jgi:hypothetical protein
MYMGQMLGSVEETSMGLISITPRDENGNPIATEDLEKFVVKDESGKPMKEWDAIADYLCEMDGEMDSRYSKPDGRKVVYSSFAPADLLRNANIFTYAILLAIIALAAALIAVPAAVSLIVVLVVMKKKRARA